MFDNPTHGTFEALMDCIASDLRPVCLALKNVISVLHPNFVEVVWKTQKIASYGVGPKKMSEHYAYIAAFKTHVNLGFYHGAVPANPDGLLEAIADRERERK